MKCSRSERYQIDCLDERVGWLYEESYRNVMYHSGELDYVGLLIDGQYEVYEVKRSDKGIEKARFQLAKAKFCSGLPVSSCYIYISMEDLLLEYEPERLPKKYRRHREGAYIGRDSDGIARVRF